MRKTDRIERHFREISAKPPIPPPGQRIALAQDQAFSFTYPHVLQGWREAGAEIRLFRPWPGSRRMRQQMRSGCPAVIPSFMRARFRHASAFARA